MVEVLGQEKCEVVRVGVECIWVVTKRGVDGDEAGGGAGVQRIGFEELGGGVGEEAAELGVVGMALLLVDGGGVYARVGRVVDF